MSGREISEDERLAMERLSIGIMDLADASGLDYQLVCNAVLIGCAAAVTSGFDESTPLKVVTDSAKRAAQVLERQIITGHQQFVNDMRAVRN